MGKVATKGEWVFVFLHGPRYRLALDVMSGAKQAEILHRRSS